MFRSKWMMVGLATLLASWWSVGPVHAQSGFTPGQVVVWRVGGDANYNPGGSALSAAAAAVFLDQFNPLTASQTAPTFTVALPTVVGTLAQTNAGSASTEGFFSRAQDSTQLITMGYNAAVGTASVGTSNPATINRSIGIVTDLGTFNTTTGFNNGPSGNVRSAAGDGSNNFWATTTAGLFHVPAANFGSVQNATNIAAGNWRNLRIFNNSLFGTSAAATPGVGLSLVGSVGTLPTGAASTAVLPGTGSSGTGTPSPYGFWLFDNPLNGNNWNGTGFDTLYVADDRTAVNGGGLQRWVYDGTSWNLSDTITFTGGVTFRGLAAAIDTTGQPTVQLWLTTSTASANQLVTITDTLSAGGGAFGTFTSLATAPTNTAFRGVDFTPVPEPTAVALLCLAGIGLGYQRWRRSCRERDRAAGLAHSAAE